MRILASRARFPVGAVVCESHSNYGGAMKELMRKVWLQDEGEDIAEYAVMLAVILVIVVGTIKLIGSQANNVFSETASAMGG
jgi:Flp pilus assembly pilin Flp